MNDPFGKDGIWFVYDGECPLCRSAALALKIKQEYGELHLINARDNAEAALIEAINKQGLDLDEGMVIFTQDNYYHGKEALKFMARYSEANNLHNLFYKSLCWSDRLASIIYPWLRGLRNLLLKRNDTIQIDNLNHKKSPTFKNIFGEAWDQLPPVMQKHYANHPYSNDRTTVEGVLDIICRGPMRLCAPLLWLIGGVPPINEKQVSVTVHFDSDINSKAFAFNRTFYFKNRTPYQFRSSMIPISGNELVEVMKFNICWRMHYSWEDNRVKLKHKGYAFKLFGYFIPLPITFILGRGDAEEIAVDDDTFDMNVSMTHPLWGHMYEYKGRFKIVDSA